jgi:hypothetical protein
LYFALTGAGTGAVGAVSEAASTGAGTSTTGAGTTGAGPAVVIDDVASAEGADAGADAVGAEREVMVAALGAALVLATGADVGGGVIEGTADGIDAGSSVVGAGTDTGSPVAAAGGTVATGRRMAGASENFAAAARVFRNPAP